MRDLSNSYILTIDLGTSTLKVIIYDREFNIVSSASEETETIYPKPNWAEQDQNLWCRHASVAIKKTLSKAKAVSNEIRIIGICAQNHGLSLVDEDCSPLTRCFIWPDLRAIPQAEKFNTRGFHWRLSAHYTAAKLLWAKETLPEVFEKAYKFLVPTDFLRTRLTKDFCTDPTCANGTQMFDTEKQMWNWELVDNLGIRHDLFPRVHPTGKVVGEVTKEAAKEMGLNEGTPVITGGGDFAVTIPALLRIGAKNSLFLYLGTAPIAGLITSEGKLISAGGMSASGGAALKWFKEQFCLIEEKVADRLDETPYIIMDQEMNMIEPGSEGLVFLPHMMGERTPYNDYARGVIFGLSLGHTREHIMRALLEGVTFQLRSYWDRAKDKNGFEIDHILAYGGGAKSNFWRQLIADVFNYPVYKLKCDDVGTLHVAALSAVALGYYRDLDEAYKTIDLSFIDKILPSKNDRVKIEKAYQLFKKVEETSQQIFTPENM